MGYTGKTEDKLRVQNLRKQGYSYNEILQHVSVSKDTISRWCRDIILTEEQTERLLDNKQFGQHKGSLIAAENKRKKRVEAIKRMRVLGRNDIGELNGRDSFIIGVALYAAEGVKMDRKVAFTNADPLLIKFMADWFIKHIHVPKERFRGRIWLHNNLDEVIAKEFWSKLTGIPLSQFHKTYLVEAKKSKKIRKNLHANGVFSIVINDATIHRKIMGWIYAMFDARIGTHSKE